MQQLRIEIRCCSKWHALRRTYARWWNSHRCSLTTCWLRKNASYRVSSFSRRPRNLGHCKVPFDASACVNAIIISAPHYNDDNIEIMRSWLALPSVACMQLHLRMVIYSFGCWMPRGVNSLLSSAQRTKEVKVSRYTCVVSTVRKTTI